MPRILNQVKTFMQKTFRVNKKKVKVEKTFQTESEESDLELKETPSTMKADILIDKAPKFTIELNGTSITEEGGSACFEAQIEPSDDPTLNIEVYHNGEPMASTHRSRISFNSGHFSLEMSHCLLTDSGEYSIITRNDYGTSVSSYRIDVKEKKENEGQNYEQLDMKSETSQETEQPSRPLNQMSKIPVITQSLKDLEEIVEGQTAHFRCQVMPIGDPNLVIEWFKNGKPVPHSYRITRCHSFGYVTLQIGHVRSDDEGLYTCRASNPHGEVSSEANLKIIKNHWLLEGTFHPQALPLINALEELKRRGSHPEPIYDIPIFETQLQNVICQEGDSVQFQCKVHPAKDPSLKIEYFVRGKPIPFGARFKGTSAFGLISFTINNCRPDDSGEYMVVASTNKGKCSTAAVLKCSEKSDINVQTQHPQGMAGLEKIKDIDNRANSKVNQQHMANIGFPAPKWVKILQPEIRLEESQPLRLEAVVAPKHDPNLQVEWSLNGKSLEQGSRYNITSEFGSVTLHLNAIYERDQGIYTCRAWNNVGQAFTSTSVFCTSKEGLVVGTQHPKGKQGYEKIEQLERSLKKDGVKSCDPESGSPPIFVKQLSTV
ncbi:titin-like isoform X2 [Cimex lectularius]|uniref:Ig-like domain-containing protein n=1 Tax=Cimex lectularius TaxID=79782 RepID=A0A8I6SBW4_CIMLE|nr:titin-like isoform X2 [Cimex lectularius]